MKNIEMFIKFIYNNYYKSLIYARVAQLVEQLSRNWKVKVSFILVNAENINVYKLYNFENL